MKKLLPLLILTLFLGGCASTSQSIPRRMSDMPKSELTTVSIERQTSLFNALRIFMVYDGNRLVGRLGTGGTLTWERPMGNMTVRVKRPDLRGDFLSPSIDTYFSLDLSSKKNYRFFVYSSGWVESLDGEELNKWGTDDVLGRGIISDRESRNYRSAGIQQLNTRGVVVHSSGSISSGIIAVLEFEGNNISSSEVRALTNRLRSELVGKDQLTIIERGKMEEILKEQAFQQTGCVSSECAVEVGKMLGVQNIITGSISKVGNIYSVEARAVSVASGEIIKTAVYDHSGDIGGLLTQGMRKVAEELGK